MAVESLDQNWKHKVGSDGGVIPSLRLVVDLNAIASNWRWFSRLAGPATCGAAIKADAYGLGARAVANFLAGAGCRDMFLATWAEVVDLGALPNGVQFGVLHGFQPDDMPVILASRAKPVLSTVAQVKLWREAAPERPCDVMVDTGMNRLGLSANEAASPALDGLIIDTLHSHLACADDADHPLNARQLEAFRHLAAIVPARRRALANSAGICLGSAYHFDLVRPGLGLYGGVAHPASLGKLASVAHLEAKIIQIRTLAAGDTVGYGATFVAQRSTRIAIVNLGYADGLPRSFSSDGWAVVDGLRLPLAGRISMDLTAVDITEAPALKEGDWLQVDLDLQVLAEATGRTGYEILTGLGRRLARKTI